MGRAKSGKPAITVAKPEPTHQMGYSVGMRILQYGNQPCQRHIALALSGLGLARQFLNATLCPVQVSDLPVCLVMYA